MNRYPIGTLNVIWRSRLRGTSPSCLLPAMDLADIMDTPEFV
jgi:hypothetical protein